MDYTLSVNFVLVTIALGLGVTITYDQIKEVANYKEAFLVGITSQFVFMPFMGWALSRLFQLNPGMFLGTIILCSSPGGAWSNFFCYHAGGNLTLSISMTAFSTLVGLGMIPFLIWLWIDRIAGFHDDSQLQIDYAGLVLTLAFVLVPTLLGIWIRRTNCGNREILGCCSFKKIKLWECLLHVSTVFGILFIVCALILGFVRYHDEIFRDWRVSIMSCLILPIGTLFGYIMARITRLSQREALTVSFETGIQNVVIPLAIIEVSFDDGGEPDKRDVMQAVLHYITIYFWELLILWFILRTLAKRSKGKTEEAKRTIDDSNVLAMATIVD